MRSTFICLLLATLSAGFFGCSRSSDDLPTVNAPTVSDPDTADAADYLSDEYIIGGKKIKKNDDVTRSTVSLLNRSAGTLCTASLIAKDVAITAAHCIAGEATELTLNFGTSAKSRETRAVEDAVATPDWNSGASRDTDTGDIALVHFSGGIPASFAPARLLSSRHKFKDGDMVLLAGFGVSNGARQSGAGQLRSVEVAIADANFSDTEILLDQTDGHGACHGDSGGPAFVRSKSGVIYLWGVTSRGESDPGDTCSGKSVYTKIGAFSSWIRETAKGWREEE